MSVEQLIFKTDGEDLVISYNNDILIIKDENLKGENNYYEFSREEAHLLYLYLKERFEPK